MIVPATSEPSLCAPHEQSCREHLLHVSGIQSCSRSLNHFWQWPKTERMGQQSPKALIVGHRQRERQVSCRCVCRTFSYRIGARTHIVNKGKIQGTVCTSTIVRTFELQTEHYVDWFSQRITGLIGWTKYRIKRREKTAMSLIFLVIEVSFVYESELFQGISQGKTSARMAILVSLSFLS